MFVRVRFSFSNGAEKRDEPDGSATVVVGDGIEWPVDGDGDFEFFLQLSNQGVLGRLKGLDLATREFPQASHRLSFGALSHENLSVNIDKRTSRYEHDGFNFCNRH